MQALVLAAGYGTRMGDYSQQVPKHLLEIKPGIPVIELVLESVLQSPRIDEINIVTNNRFNPKFRTWLDTKRFRTPIYLLDNGTVCNEARFGSIGDILFGIGKLEREVLLDEGLLVVQGDDLTYNFSFDSLIQASDSRGSSAIVVHRMPLDLIAKRFGVVETDNGKVTRVQEKPTKEEIVSTDGKTALANGGYYIFKKADFKIIRDYAATIKSQLNPGERLILDKTGNLFAYFAERRIPLHAYEHPAELWWDVGTPTQLEAARRFYRKLQKIS